MRGIHLGQRPTTTPGGGGASNRVTFYVLDDVVYLTDPVTGYTFEAPVTFVGPTTLPSGLITAEPDILLFHYAGGTWSSPATQVEGTAPVGGTILNDTFYVTIASVTYSLPVTATEGIPGMPPGGDTSLVVIDGVEYLRIVFEDGEVRYEQVHETPTPDAEGGGGGGSPPSDLPYDPVLWDGNLNAATKNVLRDKFESLGTPVNVRSFGALGNDSAADGPAIQAAINSLPTGGVIYFPAGIYRSVDLTLPNPCITFKGDGPALSVIKWTTLGAGHTGLAITAHEFRCEGMQFRGPSTATVFALSERLVSALGTNTTTRLSGLQFSNCRFSGSGSDALYCQYVNNIQITDCSVDEIAYSGLTFLSCNNGRVRGGQLSMLTAVGSSSNAYGIILTHSASGFAGSGLPTDAEPFCNDWVVQGLTVLGPNIWQGIDTHGAFNVNVESCRVFAAKYGISLTTSSGAASNFAGYSNKAVNNTIDINNIDGTASGAVANTAIMIAGGSGSAHEGCVVSGNIIRGYGPSANTPIRIGIYARGFIISNNVLESWGGYGIFIEHHSAGGVISGNIFRDCLVDEDAQCINLQGVGIGCIMISGNGHFPLTNNAAYGIVTNADVQAGAVIASGNDFTRCTTQQSLGVLDAVCSGPFLNVYGPGAVAKVSDSSATGSPKLALYQAGSERAFLQYAHGDATLLDSDAAIKLNPSNTTALRLDTDGTVTVYNQLLAVNNIRTTAGQVIVPDDPYNPTSWDGNLSVPTKNAVRDKIESLAPGIIGFTASDTAVATGKVKGFVTCPYAATISGWSIVVDAGTATVKVWKIASGTAKPTIANVINTSGVAIASGTAIVSTTVTDFTTLAVAANDIFAFDITATSGVSEITFQLKLTRT